MKAKTQLIVVAGGLGTRLGHAQPKALVELAETPLLVRTLRAFQDPDLLEGAIVVYPQGHEDAFAAVLKQAFSDRSFKLVPGGKERYDSVRAGLQCLDPDTEFVAIHDAARPFIEHDTIQAALEAAQECGAATVASRCSDTILIADDQQQLDLTPERSRLWSCQTPQVFRRDLIESAYASPTPTTVTDDATLVQLTGATVRIVEGTDTNLKITTANDLNYAEFLIEKGLV